jgi:hypothetical protein
VDKISWSSAKPRFSLLLPIEKILPVPEMKVHRVLSKTQMKLRPTALSR